MFSTGWQSSDTVQIPETKLLAGHTYYWKAYVRDGLDGYFGTSTQRGSGVWSFTTADVPMTSVSTATPTDAGVVVSTQPTLSVAPAANPNNRTLKYRFRVATGADTRTGGGVLLSNWFDQPTWAVPAGSLQDGTTYSWTVLTRDEGGYGVESPTPWVGRFTVNTRLGSSGPFPADSAGPVSVNLASGERVGLVRVADGVDRGRTDGGLVQLQLAASVERGASG